MEMRYFGVKGKQMKNLLDRITVDDAICNGKPTIRGKRITVKTILEFLSAGETKASILKEYPSLESEDIDACLQFAASVLDKNYTMEQINL
jgi:uncharacterized protein (DUF433 family)